MVHIISSPIKCHDVFVCRWGGQRAFIHVMLKLFIGISLHLTRLSILAPLLGLGQGQIVNEFFGVDLIVPGCILLSPEMSVLLSKWCWKSY